MLKHYTCLQRRVFFALLAAVLFWGGESAAAEQAPDGSFSLVDHRGRAVTNLDYRGKYMLIFFGYVFCPDVCPTGLQTMGDALDILGETGDKIQPIFVSVDPNRDTPEALAGYVSNFHPRLIGLTGDAKQIADVAWQYNVRYYKVFTIPNVGDDNGKEQKTAVRDDGNYSMSHSALTYLVDAKGKPLAAFPHGITPEQLADEIRAVINGAP